MWALAGWLSVHQRVVAPCVIGRTAGDGAGLAQVRRAGLDDSVELDGRSTATRAC